MSKTPAYIEFGVQPVWRLAGKGYTDSLLI